MRYDATSFLTHNLHTFGPIQDVMNMRASKSDTLGWRNNDNNWSRAIFQEAAEKQNHVGWTWWRNDAGHMGRAFMELVDIQHFWISAILQTGKKDWKDVSCRSNIDQIIERIKSHSDPSAKETINNMIDLLVFVSSKNSVDASYGASEDLRYQNILAMGTVIQELVILCGKTNEDLYSWYAGKSSLNLFRYDNGYKQADGGYIKEWMQGGEDNDYLETLILDPNVQHTTEGFYNALAKKYSDIKGGIDIKQWGESPSKELIDTLQV